MPLTPELTRPIDWTRFQAQDSDLEVVYNLLLEREVPLTTEEMARAVVERRLASQREAPPTPAEALAVGYFPRESYIVGARLTFPALDGAVGTVVGERPGVNPDLGSFRVIQVRFGEDAPAREFATALADHKLNVEPEAIPSSDVEDGADSVIARHGRRIGEALERRLGDTPDIVRLAGRWFPASLLAEIHQGHLNLAEAVLDVNGGGPLRTPELLAHVDLPESFDPALAQFSLDYALQQDERFDEVGPAGQVLWHLRRLEPAEVLTTPARLEPLRAEEDRTALTPELLALEGALDDELSPLPEPSEPADEVVLSLLFPHWRVGALPLSSRLRPLFPTAYEAPRIRFMLVDGHSGDRFPGWVVREARYVYGLDAWYRRYEVPAGGLVRVRRGEAPGEVIVEAAERKRRTEWIRTVVVRPDGTVGFTMSKQPVGTSYEERMIVGLTDPTALDAAWSGGRQRHEPFTRLVQDVCLELAKLNPQSAVHAESLYSGINVLVRAAPAAIFTQLLKNRAFQYVGDLYWRRAEVAEGGPR
jgi:hypothetical protein